MSPRAGILTISDKGAAGEREDTSGAAIRELLGSIHATVERYEVIPDEQPKICERLRQWADGGRLDLIVTTGGTGLGPRDVTPEATWAVIDYEVPGLAEAMRAEGLKQTPMSMLCRAAKHPSISSRSSCSLFPVRRSSRCGAKWDEHAHRYPHSLSSHVSRPLR